MEGFYFYWISWCVWIFVTFILEKSNPYRLPAAIIVLVSIILAPHVLEVHGIQVTAAGIFLLFACYGYFVLNKTGNYFYHTFAIFCLTLITASFLLLALYDPFWVVIDLAILQSFLFTGLALLLFRDYLTRIIATTAGLIQGDALYSLVLQQFYLDHPVASLLFLDRLALTHLVLAGWTGLEQIRQYFLKNPSLKKEKQM